MPKVVKRTFSLTEEQAKFIDSAVERGDYASGSEVVREGLRELREDQAILDDWLRREVVPVIDRIRAGKEKLLSPEEVRRSVRREYQRLLKAAE
jgi:antitoxin ParD1/3/4